MNLIKGLGLRKLDAEIYNTLLVIVTMNCGEFLHTLSVIVTVNCGEFLKYTLRNSDGEFLKHTLSNCECELL